MQLQTINDTLSSDASEMITWVQASAPDTSEPEGEPLPPVETIPESDAPFPFPVPVVTPET
jgi:hypothetical protein